MKKIFSFWIDQDLKTALAKLALDEDTTMGRLLNRMIRKIIKGGKK